MKTRIISGAVAILLLCGVLWLHSTIFFNIAFSLIGCLMTYEIFKAYKQDKRIVFLASSLLLTIAFGIMPRYFFDATLNNLHIAYMFVLFAYIVISAGILLIEHENTEIGTHAAISGYTILIAVTVYSISYIEVSSEYGLYNLILTFCGAWLADSGAYFVGTFAGKHKLCPSISPKKTVEGLAGGIVSNALILMLAGYIMSKINGANVNYIILAVAGVICAVLGLIGDLLASLVKRSCGIKDFGKIMPGHGGAMDRFDSVVFVAPFMALLLSVCSVFSVM